jgi:hypothetical protein
MSVETWVSQCPETNQKLFFIDLRQAIATNLLAFQATQIIVSAPVKGGESGVFLG